MRNWLEEIDQASRQFFLSLILTRNRNYGSGDFRRGVGHPAERRR